MPHFRQTGRVTRRRDLGGETWQIRESLGDTWRWYLDADRAQRNSVRPQARSDGWFPARVPGSVIDDLVRAGELADPRHGRQSREAEWVTERSWVYRCTVHLDPLADEETVWIDAQGIDPGGRIFWDGVEVGGVRGLHRRVRVRIGRAGQDAAAPGPHALTIVVAPATRSEPQVGVTGRVRELAPRVGQGWDFSPRLRHQGIWRPLTLVVGATALGEIRVRSSFDLATRTGTIAVDAEVDGGECAVNVEVLLRGTVVGTGAGPTPLEIEIADAEPWWPAGYGDQPLYEVRVRSAGDERTLRTAFRDARLVPNAGAPAAALGYTALVNGVRMPLPGWNWAPVDVLFGTVDAARTRHLVDLAVDSGARLLRVWGGGILESDVFYDACDEAGLLVWQEFSQSSSGMQSTPAEDPVFLAHMVDEARHAAARLARHPSLFIWGGGNELEDDLGPLDETRSPALAALRTTLAEADPGRAWLPTSPSGPVFHHRLDRIATDPDGQHDVHGPWEHQGLEAQYTLADAGTNLAHTEFGVEGMSSLRQIKAIIPPADRWPADRTNPVYRHLGDWWNNAALVSELFAGRLGDLPSLQRGSQWLQATGLQYAIEGDRRRWPRCSMVLPWQLAESFPNAWCTSVVEWSGEAKPAFHAARRAFAPRRATIRTPRLAWGGHALLHAEAWVWSERLVVVGSRVTLRLRDTAGLVHAQTTSAELTEIGDPAPAAALTLPHPGGAAIMIWEAEWVSETGETLDLERSATVLGTDLGGLLDLDPARVEADATADADTWRIRLVNTGFTAVIGTVVHDDRAFESPGRLLVRDDPRPLLPGEHREISVRWYDVAPPERRLALDAWNLPRRRIETQP